MNITKLFDLQLFADGAATAAAGTATGSTGEGTTGNVAAEGDTAVTASKRKAKANPFANVKFGKQVDNPETAVTEETKAEGEAEGNVNNATPESDTVTAPKTYTEDEYKKGIEEAVKRRFKNNANEKKAMEPILRYVSEALGVDIDDIEGLAKASDIARNQRYEDEAGRTGNDVEVIRRNADNEYNVRNYEQELKTIREERDRQARAKSFNDRIEHELPDVLKKHPDFNYEKACENRAFERMVYAGFPLMNAYESAFHDQIVEKTRAAAFEEAKQQVSASVAAGANRPMEGGATNPSAQVITDPKNMTKAQRAEVKRQVRSGVKIIW